MTGCLQMRCHVWLFADATGQTAQPALWNKLTTTVLQPHLLTWGIFLGGLAFG